MEAKKMGQPRQRYAPQDKPGQSAKQEKHTTQLTPRHQRIHTALTDTPAGLLSFDLRHKCGCMNIADEVMAMRRQGFKITCTMEPFITADGGKGKIGRYRLVNQEGDI